MEIPPDPWIEKMISGKGKLLREGNFFRTYEKGVLIHWEHVGSFFIEKEGGLVHSRVKDDVDPLVLNSLAESTVRTISWFFQGATIVHGGAVRYRDKVICLVGDSGAGKSTLIKNFLAHDALLLAEDDLIFPAGDGSFLQGGGHLKLWEQGPGGIKIHARSEKQVFPVKKLGQDNRYFPDVMVYLAWGEETGIIPVGSFGAKVSLLHQNIKGRLVFPESWTVPDFLSLGRMADTPAFIFTRYPAIQPQAAWKFLADHLLVT